MIEIKKWVKPDISKILPTNKDTYSPSTHQLFSVIFKDQILVVSECGEKGISEYGLVTNYYGLRLVEEKIEVCIPKCGWVPIYKEIQDVYSNEIADKAILGD